MGFVCQRTLEEENVNSLTLLVNHAVGEIFYFYAHMGIIASRTGFFLIYVVQVATPLG